MIRRRTIRSPDEWHSWRTKCVTASEVACVFGLHPYKTRLELWADKSGLDTGERIASAVMLRGQIMEPAVARAVEIQRPEWRLEKCTEFFDDEKKRIGATPDYWIFDESVKPYRLGLLQCKTASPRVFAEQFTETSLPFWITMQTLTEFMLATKLVDRREERGGPHKAFRMMKRELAPSFAAAAVLLVDAYRKPEVRIYDVPRHRPAEKKIVDGVRDFWTDVDAGRQPTADYSNDGALLSALYPTEFNGTSVDLSTDNVLPVALARRDELLAQMKESAEEVERIETHIKAKMKTAEIAFIGDRRATWKEQRRKGFFVEESRSRVLRIGKPGSRKV